MSLCCLVNVVLGCYERGRTRGMLEGKKKERRFDDNEVFYIRESAVSVYTSFPVFTLSIIIFLSLTFLFFILPNTDKDFLHSILVKHRNTTHMKNHTRSPTRN